ncbi:MAG: UDPGP type 1 family protein [Planctomycetaceae bacterium]|nr:UDPGP type 1 family protein [Planctomycetaceae bacterium]
MADVQFEVAEKLNHFGQSGLLKHLQAIDPASAERLLNQINKVDLRMIQEIWQSASAEEAVSESASDRISRAQAPATVVRQPEAEADQQAWTDADSLGAAALAEGRVAVITVAGGQGSRLGFDHPKGMFPIGPVTNRTLFQIFGEQIQARCKRHHADILWLIMTSDATHDETVSFFEENDFFGLESKSVHFFQQGSLPAIDAKTGELLLSSVDSLCLSPDGHGGLVNALKNSGLLDLLKQRGVEHLFYHQVDNPTVIMCDPALLGFHIEQKSQLTTNVVRKVSPTERMGVLADVDGRTQIIEYSELSPEQAASEDENGQWIFWAGNTAIHVFSREFLEQLAEDGCRLPLHVARKNVAFLRADGTMVKPDDPANPNAVKLERFIFDALPMAEKTLIVEGNRDREFNPVKNREGADSPATSRAALNRIAREWLAAAGIEVSEEKSIEISPLTALDAAELSERETRDLMDEIVIQ